VENLSKIAVRMQHFCPATIVFMIAIMGIAGIFIVIFSISRELTV